MTLLQEIDSSPVVVQPVEIERILTPVNGVTFHRARWSEDDTSRDPSPRRLRTRQLLLGAIREHAGATRVELSRLTGGPPMKCDRGKACRTFWPQPDRRATYSIPVSASVAGSTLLFPNAPRKSGRSTSGTPPRVRCRRRQARPDTCREMKSRRCRPTSHRRTRRRCRPPRPLPQRGEVLTPLISPASPPASPARSMPTPELSNRR